MTNLTQMNEDRCPHCLQPVSNMPYVNFHPVMGWVECAACGVVFSPKSIRDVKIDRAKNRLEVPKKGLIIPATAR